VADFGVKFLFGAAIGASLQAAFGAVQKNLENTRSSLKRSSVEAKTFQKALDLRARRDDLSAKLKASGGTDAALRKELTKVSEQYRKAKTAAMGYGVSVAQWAARQKAAAAELERSAKKMKIFSALQEEKERRSKLRGSIMGTVAQVMTVSAPVKLAIDYESAMADVKKVTNFDDEGFKAFSAEVLKLSTRIPMSAEGLAKIAAAAGQAGIAENELLRFSEDAAKMAVAFDISAEEAGSAMTGLRTNFKLNQDGVIALGDTFNHLANNMDARAGDLINFSNRVAGTGVLYGFTGDRIGALGAAFVAMKTPAEVASRATNGLMMKLGNAATLGKDAQAAFKRLGFSGKSLAAAFKKDGQQGLLSFLEAVKQSKDPMRELNAIMGEGFADEIAKLVGGLDTYKQALLLAGDEEAKNGSMNREYSERAKTTANSVALLKNSLARLGITLGSAVLPALNSLVQAVAPYVSAVADFAGEHQGLTAAVMGVAAGLVAARVAMLGGMYLYSTLRSMVLGARIGLLFLRSALLGNAAASVVAAAGTARHRVVSMGMAVYTKIAAAAQWLWNAATNASIAASLRQRAVMVAQRVASAALAAYTGVATAAQWLWNAAMTANPVGLVVAGVAALIAGMVYLYNTCEPVRAAFDAVFSWIGSKAAWRWEKITVLWQKLKSVGSYLGIGGDEEPAPAAGEAASMSSSMPASMPAAPALPSLSDMLASLAPGGGAAPLSGAAPGVQANFAFSVNGVPDRPFADGVINALERRKSELERLVSSIVHDQMRVAYGSGS
jgi:TP901 family phage tail tape measure protein